MQVEVRLYAGMRAYAPHLLIGQPQIIEVPAGATGKDLVRVLGIPEDVPKILVINGRKEDLLHQLKEGDRIGIFPPVGGG
jgi:molybdopterin converting factor small subunit